MINPAAPDGVPPRRINDGNILLLALPCLKRGPDAGNHHNIIDCHCQGVDYRSCAYQQNR